jgi:hypothetical protein
VTRMDVQAPIDSEKCLPVTIPAKTPASVRRLALASVGALLVTALYLVAVRREVLILDLAKLGSVSCF